ncbi:hypothetical protein ElyMa_003160500 [Elysia marginata]|uniref:Uncharacterized protein n=1 Tax=Elysia marginata TaxID=1093978 RepID=A0AAV4IV14_9GAST|nr:hypothetical protein ElyMa_003160500 [Elysia marginata]
MLKQPEAVHSVLDNKPRKLRQARPLKSLYLEIVSPGLTQHPSSPLNPYLARTTLSKTLDDAGTRPCALLRAEKFMKPSLAFLLH